MEWLTRDAIPGATRIPATVCIARAAPCVKTHRIAMIGAIDGRAAWPHVKVAPRKSQMRADRLLKANAISGATCTLATVCTARAAWCAKTNRTAILGATNGLAKRAPYRPPPSMSSVVVAPSVRSNFEGVKCCVGRNHSS